MCQCQRGCPSRSYLPGAVGTGKIWESALPTSTSAGGTLSDKMNIKDLMCGTSSFGTYHTK